MVRLDPGADIARLWPGIADAAALAVMFRLALGQVRPGWYTVEAWVIFTICSSLMIGANIVADRADPMGAAMHGAVPVGAMLVWHLIVHGRPAEGRGLVRGATPAVVASQPAEVAARTEDGRHRLSARRSRLGRPGRCAARFHAR